MATYQACEDCGCRVYNLGCVNCNEEGYIDEQAEFDKDKDIYQTWPDLT